MPPAGRAPATYVPYRSGVGPELTGPGECPGALSFGRAGPGRFRR